MDFEELKNAIYKSKNVVFFGGAGTSTESGIPDFRSGTGLYSQEAGFGYPPEVILSHSFFISHTKEFYRYYRKHMIYENAKPNPAHRVLAQLEKQYILKAVITQNIDGLHQMAGSSNVLELHGSVHRNYCLDCASKYDLAYIINSEETVPRCDRCGGIVRPDVVLYEEMLDVELINKAAEYIKNADILIVGGTSLQVNPAAGLVGCYRGNMMVLINKSPTPYDSMADLVINDSIGKVLNSLIN